MFDLLKRWLPGKDEIQKPKQASKQALSMLRREYHGKPFNEENVKNDPFEQFSLWFDEAVGVIRDDPNAMTVGTGDTNGNISTRTVLLKGFDEHGFVFYTNYNSRKGRQIADNPNVSLTFYWPEIVRQIHIQGVVEKVSEQQSDEYFRSRPHASQISAVASVQSTPVQNRNELEQAFRDIEKLYSGKEVPRPKTWGGYLVKPVRFEFWQGRLNRLHDRICYTEHKDSWKKERLAP